MELSKLNFADLKGLLLQVGTELNNREKSDLEAARKEINAIAQRAGLSLKDLIGNVEAKGKVRKQSGKVAVQYRNPQDASQQWTGRGRQPKWVQKMIAAGASIECARI